MAPVLIIGLNGRFDPVCSWMELNGVAARFDADALQHLVGAHFLHGQAEGERLGNRLDGERLIAVAAPRTPAVGGDQADAEVVGIGLARAPGCRWRPAA
jgi:hypothetical protein